MPKQPQKVDGDKVRGEPRKESQVLKKLKEISSFLSDIYYPDGTPIGNVQLTLRTKGPLVVAQMKIAGMGGLRLTCEALHVDDALMGLEAALNSEPPPWEPDPYPLDGHSKKKK